jgi:hypothetical protein
VAATRPGEIAASFDAGTSEPLAKPSWSTDRGSLLAVVAHGKAFDRRGTEVVVLLRGVAHDRTVVAGISDPVSVEVADAGVRRGRASVARISHAVAVEVALLRIREGGTVIVEVGNTVLVAVPQGERIESSRSQHTAGAAPAAAPTSIESPVQNAEWDARPAGAMTVVVGLQRSSRGS